MQATRFYDLVSKKLEVLKKRKFVKYGENLYEPLCSLYVDTDLQKKTKAENTKIKRNMTFMDTKPFIAPSKNFNGKIEKSSISLMHNTLEHRDHIGVGRNGFEVNFKF